MAKQQKRPTRLQKIEASRLAAIEEKKQLRSAVSALEKRVDRLENEDADGLAYQRQNAPLRPQRNFIGKEQAE